MSNDLASDARPRQARSIATRLRLLDATIECLVECGYASMTTAAVCKAAGVSQGALFKHFSTKAALLAATVEHLFGGLILDFRRSLEGAPEDEDGDRIGSALRLLERAFREPRLLAGFELYVAARTDRELRASLEPVVAAHREALRLEARALFPTAAADSPDFDAFVDVVLSAIQGRALGSLASPDPRGEVREQVTLYRLARAEFGERPGRTRRGRSS